MNTSRQLQIHGLTDVGCQRPHNEDCFLIQPMDTSQLELNDSSLFELEPGPDVFAAVSDGMGGAAKGEVASQTALTSIADFLNENREALMQAEPEETVDLLEGAMQHANKAIIKKANDIDHRGMGATLTAFYLKGDVLYLFQIGDSRAYVLREGKLNRVTRDQSFVGHLVEMGTITEEQAMKHPQRNVILQAMGTQEELKVDVSYLELCAGDLIIICSDGLYGEFTPDLFKEKVLHVAGDSVTSLSQELIDEAKEAGGKDNITLISLRVGDGLPRREPGEEPRYQSFPKLEKDRPIDRTKSVFP